MKVISHTDINWLAKFRRINGALTYSQDLVKYQIPKWRKHLDGGIISTCPKFSDVATEGTYKTAIQYLHSYPYTNAVKRVRDIIWKKRIRADQIIFITAYKAFQKELIADGVRAVWIPMAIDVNTVRKHKKPKKYKDRILYFGNILHNKLGLYNKLKTYCKAFDLQIDTISTSKFNKFEWLTQEQTWEKASQYEYGIGVGRCLHELHALDVKTLVAGQAFGGLITTPVDYRNQLATNMNGRIWTYSSDIPTCLAHIDKSIINTTDIKKLNHAEMVSEYYEL